MRAGTVWPDRQNWPNGIVNRVKQKIVLWVATPILAKPVSTRLGAQTKQEAAEKLKTNKYVQVFLKSSS